MNATIDASKAIARLNRAKRNITGISKRMYKLSGQLKQDIINRTQSGDDNQGKSFARYSDLYIKIKDEAGKPSTPVNLTYRADMLKSITRKLISGGFMLYFADELQRKKAYAHHFGKGQKKRAFFAVGNLKKTLIDDVGKLVKAAIR